MVSFTYLSILSRHCQADSLLVSVLDNDICLPLTILGTAKHTHISPLVLIGESNSIWWCFFRHWQADSPFCLSYWLWVHWPGEAFWVPPSRFAFSLCPFWWATLPDHLFFAPSNTFLLLSQFLMAEFTYMDISGHFQADSFFWLHPWWWELLNWQHFLGTAKQLPLSAKSLIDGVVYIVRLSEYHQAHFSFFFSHCWWVLITWKWHHQTDSLFCLSPWWHRSLPGNAFQKLPSRISFLCQSLMVGVTQLIIFSGFHQKDSPFCFSTW